MASGSANADLRLDHSLVNRDLTFVLWSSVYEGSTMLGMLSKGIGTRRSYAGPEVVKNGKRAQPSDAPDLAGTSKTDSSVTISRLFDTDLPIY